MKAGDILTIGILTIAIASCQNPQIQALVKTPASPTISEVNASPAPSPTSASPATPTASSSPQPSPAEGDRSFYNGHILGVVEDEDANFVDGATVSLHSLDQRFPFAHHTTSHNIALYYFTDVPITETGIPYSLTASKSGYRTVTLTFTLTSHPPFPLPDCYPKEDVKSWFVHFLGEYALSSLKTNEADIPLVAHTSPIIPLCTSDGVVYAQIKGLVQDDKGTSLDGVLLTARSLNNTRPYEATTTSVSGVYVFKNVPPGVTIQVMASKAGMTTRIQSIVTITNTATQGSVNDLNFINVPGGSQMALSYLP